MAMDTYVSNFAALQHGTDREGLWKEDSWASLLGQPRDVPGEELASVFVNNPLSLLDERLFADAYWHTRSVCTGSSADALGRSLAAGSQVLRDLALRMDEGADDLVAAMQAHAFLVLWLASAAPEVISIGKDTLKERREKDCLSAGIQCCVDALIHVVSGDTWAWLPKPVFLPWLLQGVRGMLAMPERVACLPAQLASLLVRLGAHDLQDEVSTMFALEVQSSDEQVKQAKLLAAVAAAALSDCPSLVHSVVKHVLDVTAVNARAAFLVAICERCPSFCRTFLPNLEAHLEGTFQARSAAVTCLTEIAKGGDTDDPGDRTPTQLQQDHTLLLNVAAILLQRVQDQHANVRVRVLQELGRLLPRLPIQLWTKAAEQAVARANDEKTTVRAAALKLLEQILEQQPFGSLAEAGLQEKLERQEELEELEIVQNMATSDAADAEEGTAAAEGNKVVAVYRLALEFSVLMKRALAQLPILLHSGVESSQQGAIAVLQAASKADVDGCDTCIRAMLSLAAKRTNGEGTRNAVKEAFQGHVLADKTADQIAVKLISLLDQSTLEVQHAMQQQLQGKIAAKFPEVCKVPITLLKLTDERRTDGDEAGATAAVSALALLAGAQPQLCARAASVVTTVALSSASPLRTYWALKCVQALLKDDTTRNEVQLPELCSQLATLVLQDAGQHTNYSVRQLALQVLCDSLPIDSAVKLSLVDAALCGALAAVCKMQDGSTAAGDPGAQQLATKTCDAELGRLFQIIGEVMVHAMHTIETCDAHARDTSEKEQDAGLITSHKDKESVSREREGHLQQVLRHSSEFVTAFCRSTSLLAASTATQQSALRCWGRMAFISRQFCQDSVGSVFALMVRRVVHAPVRQNLVVTFCDLLVRWPLVIQAQGRVGQLMTMLRDPDHSVRLTTLACVSGLMMAAHIKLTGSNMVFICKCRLDHVHEVRSLAEVVLGSIAAANSQASPVLECWPELLKSLAADDTPADPAVQLLLQMLDHVKQQKQRDALLERVLVILDATCTEKCFQLVSACLSKLCTGGEDSVRHLAHHCPRLKHIAQGSIFIKEALECLKRASKSSCEAVELHKCLSAQADC